MAGKLNKQHALDRIHQAYRERCEQFAGAYGYDANWLATWFEQFSWMHQREQGMHPNLAAFMAMRDVEAFFHKPGGDFN